MTAPDLMPHDRATELLPWLVNDTLDPPERDAVHHHATSCVICRREITRLEALHAAIASTERQDAVKVPSMRRINTRIDALLDRENFVDVALTRLREWFGDPWRLAFALQTALLITLGVLWLAPRSPEPEYRTLTEPQSLPAGYYVRVVFDPTLDSAHMSSLLEGTRLTIVSGPSARGVYTLRFTNGTAANERTAVVTALQGQPGVLFVQQLAGGEEK